MDDQKNIITENTMTDEPLSPAAMRDLGILLWETGLKEKDDDKKRNGLKYLLYSFKAGDVEAAGYVGNLFCLGILRTAPADSKVPSVDSTEYGLKILYDAAAKGSLTARTNLNRFCVERCRELVQDRQGIRSEPGPLVDFEGKRITINRSGIFTPIDAVLEYENGHNHLIFSCNLLFLDEDLPDSEAFEDAVIAGIKEWEGDYRVFGDQPLQVSINITKEFRLIDSVFIFAASDENLTPIRKMSGLYQTKTAKKTLDDLINKKRSMALMGFKKWTVHSKKMILISSRDDTFTDYDEIKQVAKHEFGHALGLGDLYESEYDQLTGVKKGTYAELDGYHISDRDYNLVMCDHHGPISNNDMEMVVLAFSENKGQLYQKDPRLKEGISKALGKGN